MDIPLDDLLPTSDAAFEPVDSAEYFSGGSPFWEMSDVYKWSMPEDKHEKKMFVIGYYAALFECAIKSGRSFLFDVNGMPEEIFWRRAEDYGRSVRYATDSHQAIIVTGHGA